MANICFNAECVEMPDLDLAKVAKWIESVARSFGKSVGDLSYIFCNDEKILEVNLQYLHHDYFTDIITFDYSRPLRISGDMLSPLILCVVMLNCLVRTMMKNCYVWLFMVCCIFAVLMIKA